MKKILTITIVLATVASVWAFVNQQTFTTPVIGTNSAVAVSRTTSGNVIAGTFERIVFSVAGDANGTGMIMLVDFDQTVLVTTQLAAGAAVTLDNLDLPSFQPSLVLSNCNTTNLTGSATITFQQ